MESDDTRQSLRDLAREECSFDGNGPPQLGPGSPDQFERCLDDTLGWISQMVGSPRGSRTGTATPWVSARQHGRERNVAAHRPKAFVTGTPQGAKWQHSDMAYIRSAERLAGLRPCSHMSLATVRAGKPEHGYDLPAMLERAVSDLPQNSAVMVRLRMGTRSHAVAVFKSHFGTAHFFDADIGVFQLGKSAIDWFDVWAFWYDSMGHAYVQPQVEPGSKSGWYTAYR